MTDGAAFSRWLARALAQPQPGLADHPAWVVKHVLVTAAAARSANLAFVVRGWADVAVGSALVRVDVVAADGPDVWVELYALTDRATVELVHLPLPLGLPPSTWSAYGALRREGYSPDEARLVAAALT